MFLHFPLNILTSPVLHTHPLPRHLTCRKALPGNTPLFLLSTSHLTANFAGYTARKLNFQQAQRYNIVLLCD